MSFRVLEFGKKTAFVDQATGNQACRLAIWRSWRLFRRVWGQIMGEAEHHEPQSDLGTQALWRDKMQSNRRKAVL